VAVSRVKALGLFSGGLDSILAALVLRRAGVDVEVVTFTSLFFGAETARVSAQAHGLVHHVVALGDDYLEMVRSPRYGYGSQMNPCIDCHAFMVRVAGGMLEELGAEFVFTGEVLGQRPMSQNLGALNAVAKLSGMRDRLLRPLSAKLLPPTAVEKRGLVDRDKLLGLRGRSRKPQMALAKELGVRFYPSPAGGCLLTDPGFARRLRDLWDHDPRAGAAEIQLLKLGRHIRLSPRLKLIVARNQGENARLERMREMGCVLLRPMGVGGPVGLLVGQAEAADIQRAAAIVAGYTKGARADVPVRIRLEPGGEEVVVSPLHPRHVQPLLI